MVLTSWLSSLFVFVGPRKRVTRKHGRRRSLMRSFTGFECLEQRILLSVAPFVESIVRQAPNATTNASSVSYTATFSESVTGVDATDFAVVTSGTIASTQVQVIDSGDHTNYTVTVSGISGSGSLGLNLVDNNSIHDLAGNPLRLSNSIANFATQATFDAGAQPRSVAMGDFNGDGNLDLVECNINNDTLSILLGNGDGTFQARKTVTASIGPIYLAVGDVNSDGKLDIAVAEYNTNSVGVLLGNGDGTFQAQQTFAVGTAPRSVAIGDLNSDGKSDLVVANGGSNSVSVLLGNGNGTFQSQLTAATGTFPIAIAIGDTNGDGFPDVAVTNLSSNSVSVLRGLGDGHFQTQITYATGSGPLSVAMGDLNGDGKPDLVTANDNTNTVSVLFGNGNGTFQSQQTFTAGSNAISVILVDMNGDGNRDLVVANQFGNSVSVLLSNGNGAFQSQQTFAIGTKPISLFAGDVNGDGRPDLAAVNYSSNSISVLLNNSNGNFTGQVYTVDQIAPTVTSTSFVTTGTVAVGTNSLTINFSEAVTGANLTSNYQLLAAGADGLLGTADDVTVPVTSVNVNFNISGTIATPSFSPLAEGLYRLTVKSGITDSAGNPLATDVRDFVSVNPEGRNVYLKSSNSGTHINASAITSDGRIVLAGTTSSTSFGQTVDSNSAWNSLVQTLNPDGSIYFSTLVGLNSVARAVATSADGRIAVAGYTYNGANKYGYMNTYSSFGSAISYSSLSFAAGNAEVAAMAFQADGKVVVGGYTFNGVNKDFAIARFTSTGALDTTFNSTGKATLSFGAGDDEIEALTVQSDGKILVSGYSNNGTSKDFAVARYNTNGTLDTTFNTTGKFSLSFGSGDDIANSMAVQSDGKILVAGSTVNGSDSNLAIARLTSSGALDTTFGAGGTTSFGFQTSTAEGARQIALQPDGKILLVSNSDTASNVDSQDVVRLNADGSFDSTFGVGGHANFGMFDPSLILTSSPTSANATAGASLGQANTLSLLPDGNIVVAGYLETFYDANGVSFDGREKFGDGVAITRLDSHGSVSPLTLSSPSGFAFDLGTSSNSAGELLQGTSNSFDGLGRLKINGADPIFVAPAFPQLTNSGQTYTSGTSSAAGLSVSRQVTVPNIGGQDFARTVDKFTNSTGTPKTATVTIVGNLGSDAATQVFATSSGGTTPTVNDTWFGTDGGPGTTALIHVIHGPKGLKPTSVNIVGDNIQWTYNITVAPNSTLELGMFTIQANTEANAVNEANALFNVSTFTGQAAAFLTSTDLTSLANFQFDLAPTDLSLSNSSVPENLPAFATVGIFATTDPDAGDTFTYSLVSGAGSTDNNSFLILPIDASSGILRTAASFDFEKQNSYSIRVRSTDQSGLYFEKSFTINVTNVNETPTNIALSASAIPENQPIGTTVGAFSTTDPDVGNTFAYTLVNGTGSSDNASFTIDPSGNLKTAASFDFETQNSYSIRVRSTDQGGLFFEKVFTISVTNVNEAPTNIALSANTIPENQPIGTSVGVFSTADPDAGNTFTYTLVSGTGSTDNSSFTIDASGNLQAATSFDFETQNRYSIRVRSTDQGGLFFEKVFTISVTNVNEAPTNIALSANTIPENQPIGTTVGVFSTADPDAGNTFTYTLVSGTGSTDNSSFTIDASGTLKTALSFDFETQNSYSIRVRSTDQDGLFVEKALTITVTNVNETPTNIALSANAIPENQPIGTIIGAFSTTDPDVGNTFTYALVTGTGSTDNSSFTIDASGNLKTAASFDYETKNSYSIRVRSTDQGGLFVETSFTISVTDVDEIPPTVITTSFITTGTLATGATSLAVTFSEPVTGAYVVSNYELRRAGADGLLGTADDPLVAITSASVAGNTATLNFAALPEDVYRLTVKSTITDITGNALDGDGNGSAGSDWRKDSVVGALTTTLTSPNGFTFDPEFGGTGAGQVVQGTGNAFDGLGRLQVGTTNYLPNASTTPFVLHVGNPASAAGVIAPASPVIASGSFLQQTLATTTTEPVRVSMDLNLHAWNGVSWTGAGGNVVVDLVVDSQIVGSTLVHVAAASAYSQSNIGSGHLEATVDLPAGVHTFSATIESGGPSVANIGSSLQVNAFAPFSNGTASTNHVGNPAGAAGVTAPASPSIASGAFLQQTLTTTTTEPVRVSMDLNLHAWNGVSWTGAGGNVVVDLVVDGQIVGSTLIHVAAAAAYSQSNIGAGHLEATVDLPAGVHSFSATIESGGPSVANVGSSLQVNTFSPVFSDGTPSTNHVGSPASAPGVTKPATPSISSGAFLQQALTTTATEPVRVSMDLNLHACNGVSWTGAGGNVVVDLVVDGQVVGSTLVHVAAALAYSQSNIGSGHLEATVDLPAGQHSFSATIESGGPPVANVGSSLQIIDFKRSPVIVTSNSGRTVVIGQQSISGLKVSRTVTVPSTGSQDFARTVDTFTNSTASPITTPVMIVGNLGSDAATQVFATSSGGTTPTVNDTWFGTDGGPGTTALIHIMHGPKGLKPTAVNIVGDNIQWTYNITVAPNSTLELGMFTIQANSESNAVNEANALFNANAFTGQAAVFLTSTDLASLANFQFNQAPTDLALSNGSVPENQPAGTTVGTLATIDPDAGNTFTYSLVSGTGSTDNSSFTIDASGNLKTAASFDYESKNTYLIRVRSTDQDGLFVEKALTITVTNVNETPTNIALSASAIPENQPIGTTVGGFSTTDPDSRNTFAYTLVSGTGSTDNSSFTIDASGNLKSAANFDYETQNSYSIWVRSTDQGGLFVEKAFTISVTNVNEAPTNTALSASAIPENQPIGTTVGVFSTTDPDAGNTFTYSLVSGTGSTDNSSFTIDASGNLKTAASFDFETQNSYSIRVRSTDQGGLFVEKSFTISVTNVNETPTNIALSASVIPESQPVGTTVGVLSTTDPDSGNTFTYALVDGTGSTDNSSFAIDASGNLKTAASFDYATQNSYSIRVRSTDQGGLFVENALTITVLTHPTAIAISNATIAESVLVGSIVGIFTTADANSYASFNYSLGNTADDQAFAISGGNLVTSKTLNYAAQSSYMIDVTVTDSYGLSYTQALTITLRPASAWPAQLIDPHPEVGNQFGSSVTVLSNGNVVIVAANDDAGGGSTSQTFGAGAVYLYNGQTGNLISRLTGSHGGDLRGATVTALTNGNFVVDSVNWNGGLGAVTWGNGTTGVSGTIDASNSLIGSTAGDEVGSFGVSALSNGNYVVDSYNWSNGSFAHAGAVTWGNGASGVIGTISASNSLVGSTAGDYVGIGGVTALTNGNYVVGSPQSHNGSIVGAGSVTWGDGTTGISGTISASNSLIGSKANDYVGCGLLALTNGNYVVDSFYWNNGSVTSAGAVTWGNGTSGISGTITSSNSLVGSTAFDNVGIGGLIPLTNGNYVIRSFRWNNGSIVAAGAVTWGSGTSGISGTITASNSLVGSSTSDQVGNGGVMPLTNGNYVVDSQYWSHDKGAVTWGNGSSGVSGTISASNSLVGSISSNASSNGDRVGYGGVTALTNGNYVVNSWTWNNGSTKVVGAVTWGSGTTGISGTISASNSLVGSTAFDKVGSSGVAALTNGNYVVSSAFWNNESTPGAGAVTWGNGTSGISGTISASNSLVGSTAYDEIGGGVTPLTNGNYVVDSPVWDNGSTVNAGAVTWENGTTGVNGIVSSSNSLIGSAANDTVGDGGLYVLNGGAYVVFSLNWNSGSFEGGGLGAATFVNGPAGPVGAVSATNSVTGQSVSLLPSIWATVDSTNSRFFVSFANDGSGHVYRGDAVSGFLTPPSNMTLSVASIGEDASVGTTVGSFTTTDSNNGVSYTYSLGTSADDQAFAISGGNLVTNKALNAATQSSYNIDVTVTDSDGLTFTKTFVISVTHVNQTPTNIALSASVIPENQPVGTTVGVLSTTDPDSGDTFTYTLVTGTGSTDNSSFTIDASGNLRTAASFDYETQNSYSIRVRSTDQGGLFVETAFAVSVTDLNEGPHIFTVTTTDDSGAGSLRQAILDANNDNGPRPTAIHFHIPGSSVQTISLVSPLPLITSEVVIDGYTQPGSSPNTAVLGDNAVLKIELDGSQLTNDINTEIGLDIQGNNSIVRGLDINHFGLAGILITNAFGVRISGNFVGVDSTGNNPAGNLYGIFESANTHNTTIGTNSDGIDDLAERNLVSGNLADGIVSASWGSVGDNANLVIAGNLVGTNALGDGAIPNDHGIAVYTADGATIGGLAEYSGNLVSGNLKDGIYLWEATSNTVIQGNRVGTTADGFGPLGNGGAGISDNTQSGTLIGGTSPAARNLVSGNQGGGIGVGGTNGIIEGNFVGTDITGTNAIGNSGSGIAIYYGTSDQIGGTEEGAGNLISGNSGTGITIVSTSNAMIQGNKIGTDVTGMHPLGNGGYGGIFSNTGTGNLIGGSSPGARNLISGNKGNPIFLYASNDTTIQGNWMGVDATGSHLLANVSPYDGGYWDGIRIAYGSNRNLIESNLIGGHRYDVTLEGGDFNKIQGNTIGIGLDNKPLGSGYGVVIQGSNDNVVGTDGDGVNDSAEGNVIAGTIGNAVFITSDRNVVAGNRIGIAADGSLVPVDNAGAVTVANGSNNRIGGLRPFESNLIAFYGVAGTSSGLIPAVGIYGSDGTGIRNTVRGNEYISVHGAPPIGFYPGYRYPNDPGDGDTGGNNLQNFPGILSETTGSLTRAVGSLQSQPSTTYTIDLYASSPTGVDSVGRHLRYLGSTSVTTDSHGDASFDVTLDVATSANETVMATATDSDGNTSQFSGRIPTASSIGPYHVNEGESISLVGAGGTDPDGSSLKYVWDLNGNGIFGETGSAATNGDESVQTPTYSAVGLNGAASATVAYRVINSDGLASAPQYATVNINRAPTDISLSSNSVAENQPAETVVGSLITTDPDSGNMFTYSLVSGDGDTDNASFAIVDDKLVTTTSFDFETRNTYSIRVRSTDQDGLAVEQVLAIHVTNTNDPPVLVHNTELHLSQGGTLTLTADMLLATDVDNTPDQISFTLTQLPQHGQLQKLIGGTWTTLKPNDSLTQQDINSGQVRYVHDSSPESTDGFGFLLSDGLSGPTTARISVDSAGNPADDSAVLPSISGDGRFIAYVSGASNLVGTAWNGYHHAYLYDRQTVSTILVDVTNTGDPGTGNVYSVSLSSDGRFISYESDASNLVDGDSNGGRDIFVYDRITRSTIRVSTNSNGNEANGDSTSPAISSDGRYVTFLSSADNLVEGDTNVVINAYVHDCLTGDTTLVSVNSNGGESDAGAQKPSISGNGRFVVFASTATNLVDDDTNSTADIFLHDTQTGRTTRVSVSSNGAQADGNSSAPSISLDGRFITYYSSASNLVPGDHNNAYDVFVYDRNTGETSCVSVSTDGVPGNGAALRSLPPAISADGRFVSFVSSATNLVPADDNNTQDVFARDRLTGVTTRISDANTPSYTPVMSSDGRIIAYVSATSHLVTASGNGLGQILVYDAGITRTSVPVFVGVKLDPNHSPTDISLSRKFIEENQPKGTIVGSFSTTDPDSNNSFTYRLIDGDGADDNNQFTVDTNGNLLTTASFDYETRNAFSIRVRSTDQGGLFTEKTFAISVTDLNDNAPLITTASSVSIPENTTFVTKLASIDVDTVGINPALFTITGGPDASLFDIVGDNLVLKSPKDFETDLHDYSVQVTASDGTNTSSQIISVHLLDVNEAPVAVANGAYVTAEGSSLTLSATGSHDPDAGDSLTYEWDLNYDGTTFNVGATGAHPVVSFNDNFTSRPIALRVTDSGGLSNIATTTLTVTNVAPSAAISAPTDGFSGVSGQIRTFPLSAADPSTVDQSGTFTYVVNWGDGSTDIFTGQPSSTTVQHAFKTTGSFSLSVTATDKDGGVSTPVTRVVAIAARELQGGQLAIGGTTGNDALTFTPLTATTGTAILNGTNLGTLTLPSGGVIFYGQTGTDSIIVNGSAVADQITASTASVTCNGVTIQGQDVESWKINALGGNDTITVVSGSPMVDGGTGIDTLIGPDNLSDFWNINGVNQGTLNGKSFVGIENLTGGTATDIFAFASAGTLSGKVNGGGGLNTLDYSSYSSSASVNLQSGSATGTQGMSNIQSMVGSPGMDTLTAGNQVNTWTIDTANGGTLNGTFRFDGVESINGGSATDTFRVLETGSLSGSLNGSAGTDTLIGPDNLSNTWRVTGRNQGTLNGNSFTGIENLSGGTGNDAFLFVGTGSVTGKIDGGGGLNLLDYSAYALAANLNLQSGIASGTTGISNIQKMIGSPGVDTLTAGNVTNDWSIDSVNGGTLNGSFRFDGVESLIGGTGNDTFRLLNTGSVTGIISGSTGIDRMDFSQRSTGISVNLQTQVATDVNRWVGVESFVGSTGTGDQITGANVSNAWNIDELNGGTVGTTAFAGFENLVGGTGNDTFNIATLSVDLTIPSIQGLIDGGAGIDTLVGPEQYNKWDLTGMGSGSLKSRNSVTPFTGIENITGGASDDSFAFSGSALFNIVNGGAGIDTLDYSNYGSPVSIDLQSRSATAVVQPFVSIERAIGSTSSDTLSRITGNTTISGANSGVAGTFVFSSFENLVGSPLNESFTFGTNGSLSGSLDGNGGNDTIVASPLDNVWNLTGNGSGTLNSQVSFANITNLTGSTGRDRFVIGTGGQLAGTINGGTGNNTLDYSNWTKSVSVNLQLGIATGITGSVSSIGAVIGGSGNDILVGRSSGSILVGGGGNDTLTGAGGRDILIGGNGADTLNAGSGDDILIAGSTVYDTDDVALYALFAEWNSSHAYSLRIGNLRGTSVSPLNMGYYLNSSTVVLVDAGAVDKLTGGAGSDWFWLNSEDTSDRLLSEQLN